MQEHVQNGLSDRVTNGIQESLNGSGSEAMENDSDGAGDAPKGLEGIFGGAPMVPHDLIELEHVPALLEKIPLFHEKIEELAIAVEKLSDKVSPHTWDNHHVIQQLIFKAFFADLGNRAFTNLGNNETEDVLLRAKTSIVHEGLIRSRNLGCEVCGENRSTDRCHIIPRKLGGSWEVTNILVLCPTHHRLFDRFMLSRAEYAAIDWDEKSKPSQEYADTVILASHKAFWGKVRHGEYESVTAYDREQIPFVKYAVAEVLALFSQKQVLKRGSIYKVIDPELRDMSKKIVAHLVREKVLLRHQGAKDLYYLAKPLSDSKINELTHRIWQYLL